MKPENIPAFVALTGLMVVPELAAQPYHTETTVGGVQTLEVEGDLTVKQYGGGFGGDLKVIGAAYLGAEPQVLPGLPSGVTGYYYGPQKLGQSTTVGEFHFSSTGNNVTGDISVPLGVFGDYGGSPLIQLDIVTGPSDSDGGAAHFTLMAQRHRAHGTVTAVSHSSYGGGQRVKIHALNSDGRVFLFLLFDARSADNAHLEHKVIVKASSVGPSDPFNRDQSFSAMEPVEIANSFSTPLASPSLTGPTLQSMNADNIQLNGEVDIGAPGSSAISLNGSTGRISLSGTGSGIYSGGNPVFSLDSAGKPVFGDGSPVDFSSVTASNASTAGAFTAAGGLGSGTDSYFNGVRVGRGGGNNIISTVVGERALDSNTTGYNNLAVGWDALRYNTGGDHNLAIGSGSLRMNSMGASNTAVGNGTLSSNSTGNWNVAVGGAAMSSNTTGYQNVAVGERSMTDNTTGVYNTAVGAGALAKSTVADFNTALGSGALAETTTGQGNTAVGGVAMIYNKTGTGNTAVGGSSGYSLNGGNMNVLVGTGAGAWLGDNTTPLVTPENSIYIGANAHGHSDADDNAIVIGTNAMGEGANSTVIGTSGTTKAKIYGSLETPGGLKVAGATVLEGPVTIATPQGDISMGIYQ